MLKNRSNDNSEIELFSFLYQAYFPMSKKYF